MNKMGSFVLVAVITLSGCRATWQYPDRVIASLNIRSGDHVADIGAGDGYFTIMLADAVGPEGTVYAVDVDEKKTKKLEKRLGDADHRNVEVILADDEDPLLPDRSIDIAFLCNTYHHIEDRIAYFSRLKNDLREDGRVAIVDFKADLTGLPGLFVSSDHRTARKSMYDEMERAGYVPEQSFEYLPLQSFEVFSIGK